MDNNKTTITFCVSERREYYGDGATEDYIADYAAFARDYLQQAYPDAEIQIEYVDDYGFRHDEQYEMRQSVWDAFINS